MKKWLPAVLLAGAFLISLYVGATQIDNFWSAVVNPGSNEILWQIRFPRVTAAVIVGAALGVAGLLAQGACNNAVAEPAILGTAAGASFGARRLGAVDWFGGAGQCTLAVAGFVASRQLHPATGLVAFCLPGAVGDGIAHGLVVVRCASSELGGDAPRGLVADGLDGACFDERMPALFWCLVGHGHQTQILPQALKFHPWS